METTSKGMIRESKDDKLNFFSYFTVAGLTRYARHMKIGEIKHGRSNWQKGGYPQEEALESAMRHLMLLRASDKTEDHCSAVIFNMFVFMNEEAEPSLLEQSDYKEGFDELEEAIEEYATQPVSKAGKDIQDILNKYHGTKVVHIAGQAISQNGVVDGIKVSDSDSNSK